MRRRWLKGEPSLSDVLADPVVQLIMRRDRVDPDHLNDLLRRIVTRSANAELLPDGHYRGPTKSTGM
jgi:hypothetical protein